MITIVTDNLSGCWDEMREEMAASNVIQRDSVLLATKLNPILTKAAQTLEIDVSNRQQRNISEQPCQLSENPVLPSSFTQINPIWVLVS